VGGIMNFSNTMMGIAAPIVTGFIVESTHSFVSVFLIAGVILVAGVAAFVFLLGRIEQLPGPVSEGRTPADLSPG
jgi:MFS family permease